MMHPMRTTVTLGPEAEALVKRAMAEHNESFRDVVNAAIVRALAPSTRRVIDLPVHDLGRPLVNLDKATQLAGELEDEEILRKMSLGK